MTIAFEKNRLNRNVGFIIFESFFQNQQKKKELI